MRLFHVFALMLLTACCITMIVGCDEGMQMVDDVMTEPTEMPEKPEEQPAETEQPEQPEMETTVGGVKQDPAEDRPEKPKPEKPKGEKPKDEKPAEEPEAAEPTEPAEMEPEATEPMEPSDDEPPVEVSPELPVDMDASAIVPPEHVRRETPTRTALAVAKVTITEEEAMEPGLYTHLGKPADKISCLPLNERQEAYNNFVSLVDLPFFIEASDRQVRTANRLSEAYVRLAIKDNNWDAFFDFSQKELKKETGLYSHELGAYLDRIYFEENPNEMLPDADDYGHHGNSRYWMLLEYIRLSLRYPDADKGRLFDHYRESVKNGWVFGLDNPWN